MAPILRGRLGKWAYALTEFDLRYESAKAVKGQVVADFITAHKTMGYVVPTPWKLFFDESTCAEGSGIGIVLITPGGRASTSPSESVTVTNAPTTRPSTKRC